MALETLAEKKAYLEEEFIKRFGEGDGTEEIKLYYSPGRVNLIGEHIDYNGGLVFPCALTFGTYAAVRVRDDMLLNLDSINIPHAVTTDLRANEYLKEHGWGNYPKGVFKEFQMRGIYPPGMDILIYGEIPNGSGLSSSASLEVLIATAINDITRAGYDRVELVKMCQHSENVFNGVNCGIMDQFAVGLGRENQAILLNCGTLDYSYCPLELGDYSIVIGNTKKKRGLAGSAYNDRRRDCEDALRDLQTEFPIKALCDLTPAKFEEYKQMIRSPLARKRAEHAVYENQRVKDAVRVLQDGDIEAFGKLMNESHDSLRDLYEVTGFELDVMVEESRKIPGTIGSRMTGAGFGGCTVSLVKTSEVENFITVVSRIYEAKTGLVPEFYVAKAGQGAERVDTPIEFLLEELLAYGLDEHLIEGNDVTLVRNELLDLLKLPVPYPKRNGLLPCDEAFEAERKAMAYGKRNFVADEEHKYLATPEPVLRRILDYMASHGLMEGESTEYRDLMDARIMGYFVARPSEVQHTFVDLVQEDPEKATEYFYHLSRASHYIMDERIAKNLYWTTPTTYGDMEITINLSKPEKDPKVIAKLLTMKKSGNYPECMLCPENVGYAGRLDHPAREPLRQIKLELQGEPWYMQYSPYTYYNEHTILLKEAHVPMKISEKTFRRQFEFIELLPHYFMGSNAGLPVVGGSILNHEHYQGGHHVFPMEKASVRRSYQDPAHPDVTVNVIHWAMSAIRLSGQDKEHVIEVASHILNSWEAYTDEAAFIYAETDGVKHNAITPIARFNAAGEYELDLVLRNNITTEEYPDGVFHPHKELHHIKKENIGLIEVMGLAVLPGRLKTELGIISALLSGTDENLLSTSQKESIEKHQPWIAEMREKYPLPLSPERADLVLQDEVGQIFARVLEDAGVFKNTPEGVAAFERFMVSCGFTGKS